ncbi:MAG: ribosome silencing factor [Chloroflexi bacterium]|nr:ribosome silencing factor [Chloroflexota bacterium]
MEPVDIAKKVVEVASEKQASDISMLDLRDVATFADYFVLCTGESERQIETIREEIEKALTKEGVRMLAQEGTADSGWVLLDYGPVIVHVFDPEERAYYQLERLWEKALPVVRIQ